MAGSVVAPGGRRATYWEIASGEPEILLREIAANVAPKPPTDYRIVGQSINRTDLPAKLTGRASYVQDMRLPGMIFARVVRPPHYGAKLMALDETAARSVPGLIAVIRDGNFLAVPAQRQAQAMAGRNALALGARWRDAAEPLPALSDLAYEP